MEKKITQNPIGNVQKRSIVDEMKSSYLDYAMSVIVTRALPDVRDGLKPVHRRVLYGMLELGILYNRSYKKSARIVGEVLGKFHPHGDASVYDAMVRMAQEWSLRYPLVDGQGNFGSIDGDSPAAMRYTEARMTQLADEMLADLRKDTVDFQPNYDNTQKEPKVLPGKAPNLILNGTVGIAVGMASSIPPHNFNEIADAIQHLIENPDASLEDLMEYVKGPDFPTGGIIYDINEIKQAYSTGKGRVLQRGRAEIVESKSGVYQIIISEIPYQVNKTTLLEKIAELVREKIIDGIKDLRDESNQEGIRVVIELKKEAYPNKILNQLYKLTQLQENFYVNMIALVDGIQPKVLTLKMILEEYIKHRQVVVTRRAQFELNRAEDRAHILEGLMIALSKIDAVIKVIKSSKDKDEAKANLMKQFKLSERQSVAILEMRLQNLANLERLKIETELEEKRKLILELKALLASPKKILGVVKTELNDLRERFGDERKTEIVVHPIDKFTTEDLIPNESTIVIVTQDGYIKRLPPDTFKTQSRGGKGVIGLTTKEEDLVEHFFGTSTHSNLLFFTNTGRVFQLKAYDVPQASRTSKGQALVNFLELGTGEVVTSILSLEELSSYKYLVMVTRHGVIKKVEMNAFAHVRRSGLIAIKLREGDRLQWVHASTGKDSILLITAKAQSVLFAEEDLRPMGRNASGVRGIRLKGSDEVVGMDVFEQSKKKDKSDVLVVMANGFGKRTTMTNYKLQGRGGSGIKTAKITDKTGEIVWSVIADSIEKKGTDLIIISEKGQVIRLPFDSVPVLGRDTQGVRLMRFKETTDKIANVTFI